MTSPNSNSRPNASVSTPVPFPQPEEPGASSPTTRQRTSTNASTVSNRIRTASIKLMETNPPPGMWAAAGQTVSKAPSLADIRRGSYGSDGWNDEQQRNRASSRASQGDDRTPSSPVDATRPHVTKRMSSANKTVGTEPFPTLAEESTHQVTAFNGQDRDVITGTESTRSSEIEQITNEEMRQQLGRTPSGGYANGYIPPPKLPWTQSFMIGLKSFGKWVITPSGFLITLYSLNIVAWGGMLFLLLCNAAPAMCTPTCDDINSPRRKWVEYTSQILNALFCVTGFGLAPWRFRDLYWWAWWRIGGSNRREIGIRRLAGIHQGWFRLPGSERLSEKANATTVDPEDPTVPIPAKSTPDAPPTGIRAPPTKGWKMDFVVWNNVMNTFCQILLCFYMWHYNRITRPSWATGLFVAVGCIVAGIAGIMMWHEGKAIKKVEGVRTRKDDYNQSGDIESRSAQNVPLVATDKSAKS